MKRPDPSKKRKKVSGTKRKSTTRRKRHKTSGVNSGGLMENVLKGVALVGGALIGREGNALVQGMSTTTTINPILSGAVQAAIGFAIPLLFPDEPIIDFIGYGLVAQGGMVAAVSGIPMLQGINGTSNRVSYAYRNKRVSGGNFNTIAGHRRNRSLIAGNFNTIAGNPTGRLNGQPRRGTAKSCVASIY